MITFYNSRHAQYRQIDKDTYYRHHQSAYCSGSQREPERSLVTYHERHEAENGRHHCQEDWNDLHIPCLGIGPQRREFREVPSYGIILVQDVDTCVHRNTA